MLLNAAMLHMAMPLYVAKNADAFIVSRLKRHSIEYVIVSSGKQPHLLLRRKFAPFRPRECTERWAQLVTMANLVVAVHPKGDQLLIPEVSSKGQTLEIEVTVVGVKGFITKFPKLSFNAHENSSLFFGWDQGFPQVGIRHRSGEERFFRLSDCGATESLRRPNSLQRLRLRPWNGGPLPVAQIYGNSQWVIAEHWPSWPNDIPGAGYPSRLGNIYSMSSRELVTLTEGQYRTQFYGVNARFVLPLNNHSFIGSVSEGRDINEFRHLLPLGIFHDRSLVKVFDCQSQTASTLTPGLFAVPVADKWRELRHPIAQSP